MNGRNIYVIRMYRTRERKYSSVSLCKKSNVKNSLFLTDRL